MATIDDKLTTPTSLWKKAGNAVSYIIGGAALLVTVAGFGGMFVRSCYEMFPGSEKNVTVTKIEHWPEYDPVDGAYMGIDTPVLYIDKDKRCLEIPDSIFPIKVGDKFKYISWDFNPRPLRCNEIDKYEPALSKENSNSQ